MAKHPQNPLPNRPVSHRRTGRSGTAPAWADRLLTRLLPADLLEELLGDLHEQFAQQVAEEGEAKARRLYVLEVFKFCRPYFLKRRARKHGHPASENPQPECRTTFLLSPDMLRNYLKIAWRNLVNQKAYSFINITGLASGMAVAMLIGLWVWDEVSYNKYHQNYGRIARVMGNVTYDGEVHTTWAASPPLGNALRSQYGNGSFKHVLMASNPNRMILSTGEKQLMKTGYYFEPSITDMLSLQMRYGTRDGLKDPASILLSESVAKAFFGDTDPVGQFMKLNNEQAVKVTGVYKDIPQNSDFNEMAFIAPWSLYVSSNQWIQKDAWWQNGFQAYVQIADNADMAAVSASIKDVILKQVDGNLAKEKPQLFLFSMQKWHLYSDFENGVSVGGRIQFVWLYGVIGLFVLLLACINFMNLSTARSEKRAKEVGIRKAIGSFRSQLISQFFSESLLYVALAFVLSILLVQLILPFFNQVAGKEMSILWTNFVFWMIGIGFSLLTGLVTGSYPAVYLSSFQPIKVLKGTMRVGRLAAIPRQVLVVVQFTVSVTLIIGTIVVFRQVQFAKDRPVGYTREGLVMIETPTAEIHTHVDAVRDELKKAGVIAELAQSLNPMTGVSFSANGYDWTGKGPNVDASFGTVYVDHQFGKTVGWQFEQGRDFSRQLATDSSGIVLNQAAVALMGLKEPVGKPIRQTLSDGVHTFYVIGVIKDMLMESPYDPVRPTIYQINTGKGNFVNVRINPAVSSREALSAIQTVFKKYSPAAPFEYRFVDQEFAQKFGDEERASKLVTFFATLAILISCLGIFGLASYIAEQRTKEIGVRKVLGATVFSLWRLLSKDFVVLVLIAFFIATPIAYHFLNDWLQKYQYRTELSWWVFAVTGIGTLLITLLTVSFQAIKAALMNPVKSLRTE